MGGWGRAAIVVPAALLLAFLVVRVAFVDAFVAKEPARAATIWPAHPMVLLETGLVEVGDTAAAGRPVDKALIDRLKAASAKAPLAPEPFLVRGVEAQLAGDNRLALNAFLAARQRNPRAVAARYFLADLYLKTGQTGRGLTEISALARLVPESLSKVAPHLAAYAKRPSVAPQVREMLRDDPRLEYALLSNLASDANNARLVTYLWSGRGGDDAKIWQRSLLDSLVAAGRFDEARAAWTRFTGQSAAQNGLFDPQFAAGSLPPFGWTLESGPSGIAESQEGGRLHVLYYGRDDLILASQILTLRPGRYRLSMNVTISPPPSKSLSWAVRCLPGSNPIASILLDRSGSVAAAFVVPAGGCPAQRLELFGDAPEFPERAEITIGRLKLQRDATQ